MNRHIQRSGSTLPLLWLTLILLAASSSYDTLSRKSLSTGARGPLEPDAFAINPNSAEWPSLARLPGLGPAKAQAIVDFRESQRQNIPGFLFMQANDLEAVRGIGPATVENIRPYLKFAPDTIGSVSRDAPD